jgi:hypothetical protein
MLLIKDLKHFMYRIPILCTLYGAVDFLNVLKKGCWGGRGVLLVHNEIHYVPIGDGWEEVLVRTFLGPNGTRKSLDFQGPSLPMPLVMMLHPSKSLPRLKNNRYINSYFIWPNISRYMRGFNSRSAVNDQECL